jgi:hypothetical protein
VFDSAETKSRVEGPELGASWRTDRKPALTFGEAEALPAELLVYQLTIAAKSKNREDGSRETPTTSRSSL